MATKRKSGPITSATRMVTGVGEYILKPVTKFGGKADRELGRAIGHNPPIRGDEKVAAVARSLGYSYKWNGEEWELRRLDDGQLVKTSTDRTSIVKAMQADYRKTHRVNPSSEKFGRESEAKAYKRLVEAEGHKARVEFEPDMKGAEKWVVKVVAKANPWGATSFTTKAAAQQYARLIQHELSDGEQARVETSGREWVVRTGWPVLKRNTKGEGRVWLVQYSILNKHYSVGFSALEAAHKAVDKLSKAGRSAVIVEKKQNPESDAASMYEKFHGKESDSIAEFIEEEKYHGNLAALGQLIELKVCTVTGLDATFCFDYEGKPDKGVILASNEEGTALYFVGGDQSLKLSDIKMDKEDWLKDSMVIGDAYFVSYFTEKDFDKFQPTIYEHELGEETGDLPTLRYDRLNKRLYLDGGCYVIKKPLMRTSDGIEN